MSATQPAEVEIRVGSDGAVQPLRFTYEGTWLTVAQVGRQWQDAEGDHWLVTPVIPAQVFEIVKGPNDLWQVKRSGGAMQVV
jgi:hypothetical protein